MSDVVFILGAGASSQAGVPVMRNFLDISKNLLNRGVLTREEADSFRLAFSGRQALISAQTKSSLDIRNIESVLSAFEMGKLLGGIPNFDGEKLDDLIDAFVTLIVVTIDKSMMFGMGRNEILPPMPYGDFANLVNLITERSRPKRSVSVVTFNYDLAAEFSLFHRDIQFDYGLGDSPGDGIPILKLHGSLNWGKCESCGSIVPADFPDLEGLYAKAREEWRERKGPFEFRSRVAEQSCCGQLLPSTPFIVPPTLNKSEGQANLAKVWRRAAEELSEAESIVVVGYSYPENDSFFRHLYSLGTIGETILKNFIVYDIDTTGGVEGRFRSLLGTGAEGVFNYTGHEFSSGIHEVNNFIQ